MCEARTCDNCIHCAAEGFGAYFCSIDIYGSMYVKKNNKCKFNPDKFVSRIDHKKEGHE